MSEREKGAATAQPDYGRAAIRWRRAILPLALLAAAIVGALFIRGLLPASRPTALRSGRPIVEIVRPQAGLPDLSDLVARLCGSVATIIPRGTDPQSAQDQGPGDRTAPAAAFIVSNDGWLVTSAVLPQGDALDAVFGDGRRAKVTEVRNDPVSGLTIAKVDQSALQPLALNDQAFPRVGQFGFALASPAGSGCSAGAAMVDSDFLADGGAPVSYVRIGPRPDRWTAGMPFIAADGRVVGITSADPDSSVIPSPLAAIVIDELIRNEPSASTRFGLRAIDFAPPLSTRLGDVRSGAGVSFVQPKSAAAKAGIKAGDIATAVNDEPVSSASELNRALDALTGTATLTVTRGTQQLVVKIKPS